MMETGAVFSPDRRYRYVLWRRWGDGPAVNFIGVNPSTADENDDDPTIRRCIGFARSWGCDALVMTNVYPYCGTNPTKAWLRIKNPAASSRANAEQLLEQAHGAGLVVAAWGNAPGWLLWEANRIARELQTAGITLHALRLTKGGNPAHPLYLPKDLRPQVWDAVDRGKVGVL